MFNKNCCMKQMNCDYKDDCKRQDPIMEPVINKCVEREFVHEVKHCCPINTHIINKHIYNHTYTPMYTCTQEDVVINNDCGGCCQFMGR